MQTYYEILGIDSNASKREVKSAFRGLARKYHPDVQGDPAKFREIYEAYEVLYDQERRTKYDRLGHEKFKHEKKETGNEYPSYEEIFKEYIRRTVSTETPVDRFVKGYPSIYMGGEGFEDPHTGDIWSSAEDIRIAKMDRAYANYLKQMDAVRSKTYGEIASINDLRMLAGVLFNTKWITEDQVDESLRLLDEYEAKDLEYRTELKNTERAEEIGDKVQESAELKQARFEREIKSSRQLGGIRPGRRNDIRDGHRHGEDPDERKLWRKETGQGRKFR